MKLSIIIPTLNEEALIGRTLASLVASTYEIVLVDGGSRDATVEIAHHYTPHVLHSEKGRGRQQHQGASYAKGDALLFLHADTLLPRGFEWMVQETLSDPQVSIGAFGLSIHPGSAPLNLIALVANLRSRVLQMPYGDQALFMRREDYFRVGGFRDLPLMEDVDLVRRLRRVGLLRLIPAKVKTSPRRWRNEHPLYTTLRNWSLMVRYFVRQQPGNFHRLYSNIR